MELPRYWAFISYSHEDREIAGWLRRAIERYRVPRRLVGRPGPQGPFPPRLYPVFRDRDELPGSSDLGAVIHRALLESRYLIVIASPRSAQSRWVDQEIRSFLALGREQQVLALICDGEPGAQDSSRECFAPALRERWQPEGRRTEPLAADLRPGRDRRDAALLRLIAGMLGLGLDELRQRDRQRRRALAAAWGAAIGLGIGALAMVWTLRGALQAEQLRAAQIAVFQTQGEKALRDGDSGAAAAWLSEAYRMGGNSHRLRLQLAQALQPFAAREGWMQAAAAPVDRVALSPDGRHLVSISGRRWVEFWEVAASRRIAVHELPVLAAGDTLARPVFSEDGRYLQWVQELPGVDLPSRVWVFDAQTGAVMAEQATAASVAYHPDQPFSPDGQHWLNLTPDRQLEIYRLPEFGRVQAWVPEGRLRVASFVDDAEVVTGAQDGRVIRWRWEDAQPVATYDGLAVPITSLAVDRRAGQLAAGAGYGALRVWQLASGQVTLAGGHRFSVRDTRHAGNALRLLSIADDGLRVWDRQSGAPIFASPDALRRHKWAELSPDGLSLASSNEGPAAIWDVTTQQRVFSFDGHRGGVFDLAYAADGGLLATGGADGGIGLWRTPALPRRWHAHGPALRPEAGTGLVDAAFAPDGERYLSVGTDGVLAIYRLGADAPVQTLPSQAASIEVLRWSADGGRLLTVTETGEARRWHLGNGEAQSASLDRWIAGARSLAASSDLRWLALPSAADAGSAVWIDLETGETGALPPAQEALAFRPGSGELALPGEALLLLEIPGGAVRWRQPEVRQAAVLAWSAEGQHLVAGDGDGTLHWIDAASGAVLQRHASGLSGHPAVLALRRDGGLLAVADPSGQLVVMDRQVGVVRRLDADAAPVQDLRFSAAGDLLVVGRTDGAVTLWSVEASQPLLVLGRHSGAVNRVAFGRDDAVVLSAGADNRAALWPVGIETRPPERLSAWLACRLAWRVEAAQLTPASPGPCD